MIKNYYYLVVGILSILFALTHAIHGHSHALVLLDVESKAIFFPVWHIITAENFVFGVTFIFMAIYRQPENIIPIAWLYIAILLFRWVIIGGSGLQLADSSLSELIIDSVAIFVVAGIIFLGIRRSKKMMTHST